MIVEIKNATILSAVEENVKMNNGDYRRKQNVTLTTNTSRGVQLDGVEVWDENIGKMNLRPGEVVNLSARLIGRQYGGRWSYNLTAYNAERVQQETQNAI